MVDQLHCPACGTAYDEPERFCPDCKLPLVRGSDVLETVDERHQRARKIKPQLTEGRPVRVAGARNQAEAEFIQGLLLEEGVPSMLRRSAGFDVPDFLAAGPRDVLVPESALATAREVLLEGELISDEPPTRVVSPGRLLIGLLVALAVGALVVWLVDQAVH
jgi:predicted nucleic acid-binding Zn ribbon protein